MNANHDDVISKLPNGSRSTTVGRLDVRQCFESSRESPPKPSSTSRHDWLRADGISTNPWQRDRAATSFSLSLTAARFARVRRWHEPGIGAPGRLHKIPYPAFSLLALFSRPRAVTPAARLRAFPRVRRRANATHPGARSSLTF